MTKFVDTIVLSNGHSMVIASNVEIPKDHLPLLHQACQKNQTQNSIDKYGLYSGVDTLEDGLSLKVKDNDGEQEFITPTYRLLSNTIVAKNWLPTLFPADILKASMPLLVGQTVYTDHSWSIDNSIGSVKDVYWQDSYVTEDGLKIPAGINGVMKIDAKSNPKIARGIMMDPPSIHSNSVTVQFEWTLSHPGMDIREFWDKLGTYDEDGKLIHRIATKIISYGETSLVWAGADPFAKKIGEDGHIVLPKTAKANSEDESHYSLNGFNESGNTMISCNEVAVDDCTPLALYDFKSLSHDNTKANNIKPQINMNKEDKKDAVDETKSFVQTLIDKGIFGETVNTPELVISSIQSLQAEKDNALSEITSLKEQLKAVKDESIANASFVEAGKKYRKSIQDATIEAYTKVVGADKVDNALLETINNEETSFSVLKALHDTYTQSVENMFPMSCNHCGSHDVSRSSHIDEKDGEESYKKDGESIKDTIKNIINKSSKN